MIERADVAILGGGPAGLAAAAVLARSGRSVVVFEKAGYDAARAGETFGPEVRPLLEEIGAWDAFAAIGHVPFRGVASAWGSPALFERPAILRPLGEGFHVERARFDAALAANAEGAGAIVHRGTGPCALSREGDGFRVDGAFGAPVSARFLIDASGRGASASAAAIRERRWLSFDRLVAIVAHLPAAAELAPELLLEAAEEGWWYAVPQPGGTLLVALLTDADLVAAGPRAELGARFSAALARTVHVAALAGGAAPLAPPWLVRADSGLSLPDRGANWRVAGDAAFSCDPLGGDGVARALRSGMEAARGLDGSAGAAASPLSRLEAYLDRRASYYSAEGRWPDALFWKRRRAGGWQGEPLVLDPLRQLRGIGIAPDPHAIAPAEALLPRSAITAALELLRDPHPAHEALLELREAAPVGDRRLLVGLQRLVAGGCIAAL